MEPASVPVDKLNKYTAEELEGREKVKSGHVPWGC